ncbi:MAG: prephenate dehydrogenase/arogenate dehydrogenase family protein [Gammaproteobacteria bacterium]|nr:prephenate dehydrogenase/arogenate dehydrogenase family protein [Gammaproteobacteria bacterium]
MFCARRLMTLHPVTVSESKDTTFIEHLAVLGVGLIGGSLAASLKKRDCVKHVSGYGRSQANLTLASRLGLIDKVSNSVEEAVRGADVVLIASPIGAIGELLDEIRQHAPKKAIVTDVGSAKAGVIAIAESALGDRFPLFVPGHPVAGSERSGASAADPELFVDHWAVLTPLNETDPDALRIVRRMWEAAGAKVKMMTPEAHDRLLAMISHLPHATAYGLTMQLARQDGRDDLFDLAAGGFLDITRIASSDPVMWRDIFIDNRDEVLSLIAEHKNVLSELEALIETRDLAGLEGWCAEAKRIRDRLAKHVSDQEL